MHHRVVLRSCVGRDRARGSDKNADAEASEQHISAHADRVWGFCTRVSGHNHVNMTYYARVKRAGRSTAPPAKAELMYEPGICGLSNSSTIISQ